MNAYAYARGSLVGGSDVVVPVRDASALAVEGHARLLALDDIIAGRRLLGGARTYDDKRFPQAFAGYIERGTPPGTISFMHVYGDTRYGHVVWPHIAEATAMTFSALELVIAAHLQPAPAALLPRFHGFVAFIKNHRNELYAVSAACHWSRWAKEQECILSALPANDGLYRAPDCLLKFTSRP